MTPRERGLAALAGGEPDDKVPSFELGFQLIVNLLGPGFPIRAEQAGARSCLIGGVHCGMTQTGSDADVMPSYRYVLRHGMPGGGYMLGLSNVAYQGLSPDRYDRVVRVLKRHGPYQFGPFEVSGAL